LHVPQQKSSDDEDENDETNKLSKSTSDHAKISRESVAPVEASDSEDEGDDDIAESMSSEDENEHGVFSGVFSKKLGSGSH